MPEKCPYYLTKASGITLCVNGLELDGETPRPCAHPELSCHFTRIGIIPLSSERRNNLVSATTPTGGKKVKSLTEREIKAMINRADLEVRKELQKDNPPVKDPLPEKEQSKPKEKPIRCMYLDKAGARCLAPTAYQQKCTVEVRENRNCPFPIEKPSPEPPHRLTIEYCRQRNCPHLKKREMNNTLECELAEKVPGNMAECPLKDDQSKPSPEPSEFLLRQILKCRQKQCPELVDDETTTLCKVMETYTEKGTPWGRYDCPLGLVNTPTENRAKGVVSKSTTRQSLNGIIPFTVHADRHEMATVRNMLKYGDALDEEGAVQTMFKDGAASWLDKMERRIQEEGIGDPDE